MHLIKCRVSGKSGDGKVIFSHTQGEPFLFTFGKSEVSSTLLYMVMHFGSILSSGMIFTQFS